MAHRRVAFLFTILVLLSFPAPSLITHGQVYGAGVFSTNLNFPVTAPQNIMGFRCSFQP
ncbi:MAG TPA: hypothetical protein VFE29_08125 [Terriglobia bacterium]|nr:hypothetical protein [Terriglobia bacterium]